jgi:nuclear transport factor 2 (NTF2) superfamily protein
MRKTCSVLIALLFVLALPVYAVSRAELDGAINDTAGYVLRTVSDPQAGSVGGEWAVLGLARSGYDVPDSYFENYYWTVEQYVRERGGVLHEMRYTDYSRAVLALTAAGFDPRGVGGYDLTAPLETFEGVIRQGINGAVFALLALDSMNYPNSHRDNYIADILRRQLSDGGWNLAGRGTGNPDITGMALQALAKYQDRAEVKRATDRALAFLSGIWQDGRTLESAVQILVALCELGLPVDDALINNILSFRNADGSFSHTRGGESNQMSTEQALYGLVAAQRARDGKNSLYRMDNIRQLKMNSEQIIGLPYKHSDVTVMPVINHGRTFADIQNHANQTTVETLAARGIISGKSADIFDPNATMTRAEFSAIVTRSLGLPKKTHLPFVDVRAAAWYANHVATAFYYEIVSGTSATTFNPVGTITRQEAAVMVTRAARLAGMETARNDRQIRNTLAQFGDYRTTALWAQSSLAFCYDTGILDNYEFDIKPTAHIRRGEIAEMICRMLEKANLL